MKNYFFSNRVFLYNNKRRILLALILLIIFSSCSGQNDSFFFSDESQKVALDFSTPERIYQSYERGRYLTHSIGACGQCHGVNLGGNKAPNITSDFETGIGSWKVNEIVNVLKGGKTKSGKVLSSDIHIGLPWISDNDARAIAVYLLATKPVKSIAKQEQASMLDSLSSRPNVKGYVMHPKENANASYGRYLTMNVASCQTCHGEGLEGTDNAPKLKKRISKWSKEQIVNYLKTGGTPQGKKINPANCPWSYYRLANVSDQQAIALFLKNLQ